MRRFLRCVLLVLALAAALCGPTLMQALPAAASERQTELQPVSEQALRELVARYKGKPVVVVYWASWCMPCRQYKEKIADLRKIHPETELAVLGVSVDTEQARLRRFLEDNTLPFHSVVADDGFYETIAGTPIPTTVLYDRTGREVRTLTGNVDARRLNHYVSKLFEAQ